MDHGQASGMSNVVWVLIVSEAGQGSLHILGAEGVGRTRNTALTLVRIEIKYPPRGIQTESSKKPSKPEIMNVDED